MKEQISVEEMDEIRDLVRRVWRDVTARCDAAGLREDETSSAQYSIQDFLGTIDTDESGVRDYRNR